VTNWQSGNMALRWCAAGMIEAKGQFRRVNGHLHLAALRAALDGMSPTRMSEPPVMMRRSTQPDQQRAAAEVLRNSGHPRRDLLDGARALTDHGDQLLAGVHVAATGTEQLRGSYPGGDPERDQRAVPVR